MKCCDLSAGKLRNSIEIQELTNTPDGQGGFSTAWTTIHTPNAMIKPVSGGERMRAMQLNATVTHRIYLRYVAGIEADMRVKFGDRLFQIRLALNLEERNRWLELHCEEGAAQ